MPVLPSPYQLKKALLYPYTAYRRQQEKLEPGFLRSALEAHYYRPAFYHWLGAVSINPDLLHEADLTPGSTVLDVGAYFGEWAEEILQRYDTRVLAFEPDPVNFQRLRDKAAEQPAISAFEYGLGHRDETAKMSLEFLGSSIYKTPGDNPARFAEVEIRDICKVWEDLGLDRVELMKINIEGGEFPLLERMIEQGMMDRVDTFLIQFHEWHPGAYHRRRAIQRALRNTHRVVWDHHFIWEKWERL